MRPSSHVRENTLLFNPPPCEFDYRFYSDQLGVTLYERKTFMNAFCENVVDE